MSSFLLSREWAWSCSPTLKRFAMAKHCTWLHRLQCPSVPLEFSVFQDFFFFCLLVVHQLHNIMTSSDGDCWFCLVRQHGSQHTVCIPFVEAGFAMGQNEGVMWWGCGSGLCTAWQCCYNPVCTEQVTLYKWLEFYIYQAIKNPKEVT